MSTKGMRVTVSFGPFVIVPERAWRQCKLAMQEIMRSYGFEAAITEDGKQEEAYQRWWTWLREQEAKEAQPPEPFAPAVCGKKCSKAGCDEPCSMEAGHPEEWCSCRPG